jgi:hypothetical protein
LRLCRFRLIISKRIKLLQHVPYILEHGDLSLPLDHVLRHINLLLVNTYLALIILRQLKLSAASSHSEILAT